MEIKTVQISKINPAPYNPRRELQPGDPEYQKLENSLETFGYVEPMVWNERTGTLVSGHQRMLILKAHGLTEVEVSVVNLTIDKEKALNLALNKIRGDWDQDKLATLLEDLKQLPDFDVGLTGFDLPEISQCLDRYREMQDEDDFDFDAAVESIKESVTKPGDLIVLGAHRILCGDSTLLSNVQRLFEDVRARLYWTDYPYRVGYDASNRPGVSKSKWALIKNDDLSENEYIEWLRQVLQVTVPFLEDGCPVYLWNGHRQFWTMSHLLVEVGIYPATVITWAKPGFAPSYADYQQQTEFCLYGWKIGGAHPWYGSAESSLWEVNRDPVTSLIHPTQKPIALCQRAIRNSSQRGEVVFDSCLGSGSALVAAETLGRKCFGLEIEPAYCDAIVRRYIRLVGREKVSTEIIDRYVQEEPK